MSPDYRQIRYDLPAEKCQTVRFSYFGYTVILDTEAQTDEERRREANELVIAAYGQAPALAYVEPGKPFPDYVPCQVWDKETDDFI